MTDASGIFWRVDQDCRDLTLKVLARYQAPDGRVFKAGCSMPWNMVVKMGDKKAEEYAKRECRLCLLDEMKKVYNAQPANASN